MSHGLHPLSETLRNELEQLLMLATRGDACEMELERLNSLLRTHEELRRHAARFLRDEALLREELRVLCASELLGPDAASTSALSMLPGSQRDRSGPRARFLYNLRLSLTK